jgi:hypothetical protein
VERLSPGLTATGIGELPPSSAPAKELLPEGHLDTTQALRRADALRQAGVRFDVAGGGTWTNTRVSPQSTSEEICVDVLLNPQLDVVEFGDGTGSIEHWSIMYQKVYYDSGVYNSSPSSLVLIDENDGSDTVLDPFETGYDYDMFGQGFMAPPNLTRIIVSFSSAHADVDAYDEAWSNLYTLTPDGYLDEWIDFAEIPEDTTGFNSWWWELTSSEYPELLADLSGRLLAVAYDMLSDREAPSEWVWLDDLQVTLCYERGQYSVYLPLIRKDRTPSPQPICSPREPDSVAQPGATTVDVNCGGSFSPVDQKDYYTLDLTGASRIRLRLFDLPPGTNWDALIYENRSGYPLACQIGTPGDGDKAENCNLTPSKNYFVLVSRGPNQTGGSYKMRVERR